MRRGEEDSRWRTNGETGEIIMLCYICISVGEILVSLFDSMHSSGKKGRRMHACITSRCATALRNARVITNCNDPRRIGRSYRHRKWPCTVVFPPIWIDTWKRKRRKIRSLVCTYVSACWYLHAFVGLYVYIRRYFEVLL